MSMESLEKAIKELTAQLSKGKGKDTDSKSPIGSVPSVDDLEALEAEELLWGKIKAQRKDLADLDEQSNRSIQNRRDRLKQLYEDQIAVAKEAGELDAEKLASINALIEAESRKLDLEEGSLQHTRELITLYTGVSSQWKGSMWGRLLQPEGWKGMVTGIKDTLTPMNILGSSVLKVQEATLQLATAQDNAIAEMNKMTSAAPGLEDQLIALEHEFQSSGVTADEAGQAIGTLFQEVTDFSRMGPQTQKELADTTAVLNELGVSMGTTAQVTQLMTKTFGQSGKEAAATSRELFAFAQSIGMNADEVAQNFAQAGPEMAAFGEQGVDTFKKLQAASKASGMEVSRMLAIVEKFDKFDSAAESVGQLNAILGGPFLSSLDMVTTTDPTERMKMLSDAVNQSGQSFDEMSYYQRKALTEAMGLQDVSELALLMRDGFDSAVPAQQQSQEELAKQAEQAKNFQTIQEEMMQTVRAFAVSLRPVVQRLKSILDGVQKLNDAFGGYLIPTIVLGIAAMVSLVKVSKMVIGTFKIFNIDILKTIALRIKDAFATRAQAEAQSDAAVATDQQSNSMRGAGKAAGSAAIQMIAFGFAIMLIGAGIAIAALGVTALALAFSLMDPAQILASAIAIGVFMGGMIAVIAVLGALVAGPQAAVTGAAIGVLLAIGAAVLLIGGAVFLAATGLALLVSSFALLFNVAKPATMIAFTAAFAGFVAVLYLMVPLVAFFPVMALALGAISLAFIGMAFAMSKMDFSNFEPLADFFTSLATLVTDTEGGILRVAEAMAKITEEVNKLDTAKAIKYTAVLDKTAMVASSPAFSSGNTTTTSAITAPSSAQPVEIVLKLKESVLKKVVGEIVDGKFAEQNR